MRVTFSHLFRLMARPTVDHPLIDSFCGTVADEAVTKNMPAPDVLPPAAAECAFQMIRRFVHADGILILSSFSFSADLQLPWKTENGWSLLRQTRLESLRRAWMKVEPFWLFAVL